jgi:preprotein translocase subunit SecG
LFTVLVVLHVLVAIILIGVVLLQTGKAGSIADVFGGGGSMAAFGARGAATVLSRFTTAVAILFMITSLSLSLVKSSRTTIMKNQPVQQAPAQPPAQQKQPQQQQQPPTQQEQPQQQQPNNPQQ